MTESYSGGTLNGLSVNSAYNNQLQRASLKMTNGTTELQSVAYGYDSAGRLETVTEEDYSATYAYLANSSLIDTVTFKNGQDTRLVTTRRYDRLNRLESISSAAYGSGATNLPISYAYQYNRANQRTRVGLADGAYWVYQYDALGQVISGKKYWNDGTPVAGQQFEYGFDDIGNRLSTKAGGDENGGALRSATYTANRLNQYTQRTNSGGFDVLGLANVGAVIQVNSSTNGVYRRGEYFRKELSVDNSVAVWQGVTNTATLGQDQATETGNVFVPPTPETFGYDADGNLTNDGRWAYQWDAENRLVRMVSRTGTPTNSWRALDFGYDYQGRRISKTVSNWNGVAWVRTTDVRFLYDGWNLQAILDAQSSILQSFIWGLDLSDSLQGAGGVGGLLKISNAQSPSGDYFPAYDGNGNVTALLDASDGGLAANYEYGPFGEPIRANGPMAKAGPFRFSTKYQDDETDLLYYGHRYYNPSTGRWLSRDAIQERGGLNLYCFVSNGSLHQVDTLGLGYWPQILAYYLSGRGLPAGPCCCSDPDENYLDATTHFFATGDLATGQLELKLGKCANLIQIYWFDCYTGHQEARDAHSDNFWDYGWSPGGLTYTKQAKPHPLAESIDPDDARHLVIGAKIFFRRCVDSVPRLGILMASFGEFTWNFRLGQWDPPGLPIFIPGQDSSPVNSPPINPW